MMHWWQAGESLAVASLSKRDKFEIVGYENMDHNIIMDSFTRAAKHVRGLNGLDDKTMLRFYGLYKQVTFCRLGITIAALSSFVFVPSVSYCQSVSFSQSIIFVSQFFVRQFGLVIILLF